MNDIHKIIEVGITNPEYINVYKKDIVDFFKEKGADFILELCKENKEKLESLSDKHSIYFYKGLVLLEKEFVGGLGSTTPIHAYKPSNSLEDVPYDYLEQDYFLEFDNKSPYRILSGMKRRLNINYKINVILWKEHDMDNFIYENCANPYVMGSKACYERYDRKRRGKNKLNG